MEIRPGAVRTKVVAVLLADCAFLVATIASYHQVLFRDVLYDDAYITFRYAVNFAEGKGLVFNSYEKLNSASSLLYTLFLSAIYKLGFHDLPAVATAVGIISGLALVAYMTLFALSRATTSLWATAIFLLPLAISGSIDGWAISGMEQTLYLALLTAFFYYYAIGKFRTSLVLLVACLLTRPEAVLILVAVIAAEFATLRQGSMQRLLACSLVGCLTLAGYFGFNFLYYGNPFPHPVFLKRIAFYYAAPLWFKAARAAIFFMKGFAPIFILGVAYSLISLVRWISGFEFLRTRKLLGVSSLPPQNAVYAVDLAMSIFIILSLISYVVGPSSDYGRYMTPALPILAVGAVFLVSPLFDRFYRRPAFVGLGILVFLLGLGESLLNQAALASSFQRASQHQMARRELGGWIEANVPPSQLVITADVGQIAYVAKSHDFLDPFGLTTRLPVEAAQKGSWKLFLNELKQRQPLWAADTGTPEGRVTGLEIIMHPDKYFRGVAAPDASVPDMYSKNTIVLEKSTDDGYVFRLIQLDPTVWAN